MIDSDTPDAALMTMLGSGDDAALDEVMRRYKGKLFDFIARYLNDADQAADILQETFIRVYFKAGTYDPRYRFSTWLYRIAINLCHDWNRKNKMKRWFGLDAGKEHDSGLAHYSEALAANGIGIEDRVDAVRLLTRVGEEIGRLPHDLRVALVLYVVEENSQERCAELLGVSLKTVETRIYRARKRLAERLAGMQ